MDELEFVDRAKPSGDGAQDLDAMRHVDGVAGVDGRLEAAPLDILHREVERALVRPERVNLDDVLVADLRERARLLLEALDGRRVLCVARVDDLDRDLPVEEDVLREMDDAHRACAELANELVTTVDHDPDTRVCGSGKWVAYPPRDSGSMSKQRWREDVRPRGVDGS
jgi:hypothetical protein